MFTYPIKLPSGDILRYREITYRDYKDVVKLVMNDDNDGIAMWMDTFINEYRVGDSPVPLTLVEKFIIVVTMRIICIGPVVTLKYFHDNKSYTIKTDLDKIVTQLTNTDYKQQHVKVTFDDITTITLSPPIDLYNPHVDVADLLSQIDIDGRKTIDTTVISHEKRVKLFDLVAGDVNKSIETLSNQLKQQFDDIILLYHKNPFTPDIEAEKTVFDPFGTKPFLFIKTIFSENFGDFLEDSYQVMTKTKLDLNYLDQVSPSEARYYIQLYQEEIEKQNKSRQEGSPQDFMDMSGVFDHFDL